jgi:hypothetical protein
MTVIHNSPCRAFTNMYFGAKRVADGRLLQKKNGVKLRRVPQHAQEAYDQAIVDSQRLGLDVRNRELAFRGQRRISQAKVTVAPTQAVIAAKNKQLLTKIVRNKAAKAAALTLKAAADRKSV